MKTFNYNDPITSVNDIRTFVEHLINVENLNFHIDTPFEDYINMETKQPTYNKEEAELRTDKLNECFEFGQMNGFDAHDIICDHAIYLTTKQFA
jgi:hypothetical protein